MSKIYARRRSNRDYVIGLSGLFSSFALSLTLVSYWNNVIVFLSAFIPLFLFGEHYVKSSRNWMLGAEGEEEIIKELKNLGASYTVI